MARLDRYIDGKFTGSHVLATRDYLVGRDPECDIVLQDRLASRKHFKLIWADEGYFLLQDLGTSNGTLVDGVKEVRRKLLQSATIQVGQELLLFSSYDSSAEGDSDDVRLDLADEGYDDLPDATAHMAPTLLHKLQAKARVRQRPHLLLHRPTETAVFPLDAPVTTVGMGPVRASLGPTPDGRPKVMAIILKDGKGGFQVKSPSFWRRINVNGYKIRSAQLQGGEILKLGDFDVEFSNGVQASFK